MHEKSSVLGDREKSFVEEREERRRRITISYLGVFN
jgi:hypothetical protein